MKTNHLILTLLLLLTLAGLTSCVPVKGYQRAYLNDPCMELSQSKLDYFETNFQTYREGASGSNGGKVGGGCGCN
ncbi:MAG: DUF4266 domain-containing protein [Bacteroidia bacterium]|nr:DUF4266 domain-containing protein [Bacteroidia bacterium]